MGPELIFNPVVRGQTLDDSVGCAVCGSRIAGERCGVCGSRWTARTLHRHLALLILVMAVAAAAFVATRSVAVRARELRQADGRVLYERARTALDQGRTGAAADLFRRAAATDPESRTYRLALAMALVAGGEIAEARALLQGVRDEQPDDVDASLALARLEAAEGHWPDALQHYQHTLTALWSADQLEARRQIRMELIDALLARGDRRRALSELLVLSATLPGEPETQVAVGRMYLEAGDPVNAEEHFDRALEQAPAHQGALAGAGEAAFAQGDYVRARSLLGRVSEDDARSVELRTVSDFVLTHDPLAPRTSLAERRQRLTAIVDHVTAALDRCLATPDAVQRPGGADLAGARTALETLADTADRRPSTPGSQDQIAEMFEAAYRAQTASARVCGAGTPMDRAVLLIGARHELD